MSFIFSTPGIVGNGIIFELLRSSEFTVVAVVREKEPMHFSIKQAMIDDMVKKGVPQDRVMRSLKVVTGIQQDGSMSSLCHALQMEGIQAVDHVISCFGGAFIKGSICSLCEQDLKESFDRTMPHFRLMKAIRSYVKDDIHSSYLFITGMLGERCHMPQLAGLTISNAFLYGIILAFQAENFQLKSDFRINELRIGSMLTRKEDASHPFMKPSSSAYPSNLVGQEVIKIIMGNADRKVFRLSDQDFDDLLHK